MVVGSGQLPYKYDGDLPVRQRRGGWPGLEVPNIGPSGDLFEQAMFVLNAELRKWNVTNLAFLTYQAYSTPNIASSGFEPKTNGETFQGYVGRLPVLAINNIEQMRTNLEDRLMPQYTLDSDYSANSFLESWLATAYPASPSGHSSITFIPGPNIFVTTNATWLRPVLNSTPGSFVLDTDLHWLGGSGTLLDVDYGEVIFNPFPFPRVHNSFVPALAPRFSFGPMYPVLQTTFGTIPSVNAARYASDIAQGAFKRETNFEALQSGYIQFDGYGIFPQTLIRLTTGNDDNYFNDIGSTTDFTFYTSGARRLADGVGLTDHTARVYVAPTAQSSGMYRISVTNPKDAIPFTSIPSGFVSFWPNGRTIYPEAISQNRMLNKSISITSDGGLKVNGRNSVGFHVLDDALWLTSANAALSGVYATAGLYVVSPYNAELIWYRPAELIVATSGNKPGGPPPGGGPGVFSVHVGLEEHSADFVRMSRSWQENVTAGATNIYENTVYFQLYNQTTLDHSEQSSTWTITNNNGAVGSTIDGLNFDGSDYWMWPEFNKVHRFSTAFVYSGSFAGMIARRRHSAAGQKLYTIGSAITTGDPLETMSPPGGITSGIGVWSIATEPADITVDIGTYTHDSAKRLRAEAHFGHKANARIHMIRDVVGSTHVPNGTWMLIQFELTLYLCKIREDADEWVVEQSYEIDYLTNGIGLPTYTDFPFEFILHDID